MPSHYVYFSEAAKMLNVSRATLYRIVSSGKLSPHYAPNKPRVAMFLRDEVNMLSTPRERGGLSREVAFRRAVRKDKCEICGGSKTNTHHIVPLEKGGQDLPENVATLCNGCHSSAHRCGVSLMRKARENGTTALATRLIEQTGARQGAWIASRGPVIVPIAEAVRLGIEHVSGPQLCHLQSPLLAGTAGGG